MEIEKKYFTRKQTVVLIVAFFLLNLIGQYYGFPLRFLKSSGSVPVVSVLPEATKTQITADKFTANALNGKIASIKVENTGANIVLTLQGHGVDIVSQSVKIAVSQDTKITQQILKPKSEIDAINAKYTADVKKDPNTPLPIDQLISSIKTLSINDLKIGDSINVYPLENIVGKTLTEMNQVTAQFILLN